MKQQHKRTVVAVDDDDINLMILVKGVQDAGYNAKSFSTGEAAWEYLSNHPNEVDIALIDKMMPGVDGMELLRRIKASDALKYMPAIIQTGDAGVSQMREGLESGAFYYLTKPFHPEILTAILHSAASECTMREEMLSQMQAGHTQFIRLLSEGEFTIRTHAEARILAAAISQAAVYPEFAALGLMELLSNAIEHGNLEIGYQKKRKSLLANEWTNEVATRLASNEFGHRRARVHIEKAPSGLQLTITDEGKGFDWQHHIYDENAPGRLNEPNGRGIAKALIMLDELRYKGKGNEVQCLICTPGTPLVFEDKTAATDTRPNQ